MEKGICSCTDHCNKHYLQGKEWAISYVNIFSAAISYLESFLNEHGLSVDCVNSFQEGKVDFQRILSEKCFHIIAMTSAYYVSVLPILEIIQFVKKYNKGVNVVIGGQLLSNTPYSEAAIATYHCWLHVLPAL